MRARWQPPLAAAFIPSANLISLTVPLKTINRVRTDPGSTLAILSPIIATLIQLAVSRRREFLADASGALLTRYPEGLARALEKIAKDKEPLEVANNATAHLYIVNPFKGKDVQHFFAGLFNTHPPIEERIKILRSM